jgi:hypothetical protein
MNVLHHPPRRITPIYFGQNFHLYELSFRTRITKPHTQAWVTRFAVNPGEGREAATPSIIRIIQEVHGGKVMPLNGGIVRSENVQVKPFFPKGKFYATLDVRVPGRAVRSNSLPSGHTDLNRRHPGL